MRSIFFFALVLTLTATVVRAEIKVGDVFPALASAGLAGGTMPATEGKILVVDFWASWCAPCKASFPALGKINSDYAPRGVVLVGVSVDEKASAYAAFVKKQAPPFLALHDVAQHLVRSVVVPAMPSTYVVGRDGKVRYLHAGYHGTTTDQLLRAELELLLTEKS
ncbi:MAG: TlpA disulfide reductase family protein [Opitutaceae bacterium]